jgi:hypothetical protein
MPSLMSRLGRHRAFPGSQRGLSLVGLILLGVLIVFGALLSLKVAPTVIEYAAVQRAVVKAARDGQDPASIRAAFDRAAAIDDITSISGRDLQITRRPNGAFAVAFSYEKRIPLVGPASLLLEYQGDGNASRGGR